MNCSVQLREDHQERSIMEPHRRWIRRDSPTGTCIFMPEEPCLQYDGSQLTVPIIRGEGHWARITLLSIVHLLLIGILTILPVTPQHQVYNLHNIPLW